jgi:hypothetical protein
MQGLNATVALTCFFIGSKIDGSRRTRGAVVGPPSNVLSTIRRFSSIDLVCRFFAWLATVTANPSWRLGDVPQLAES